MKITATYLLTKGINIRSDDTPTSLRSARQALVTASIQTLFRRDFPTQNILGKYVDKKFETLTTEINPLDFRNLKEQESLMSNVVGWVPKKKYRLQTARLDEICALVAVATSSASAPTSPGDVTMNSFRFWDILSMIRGEDFDNEGDFRLTGDEDSLVRYFRYKYFSFIVTTMKDYVRHMSFEELLASVFTMQSYQLIVCLSAAFKLKEIESGWSNIKVGYPILEQKEWSEQALIDLLDNARVRDTPEWVKFMPLVSDEDEFLNSNLGGATIVLPFEDVRYDEEDHMHTYKYFGIAPLWNKSVIDHFGGWGETWWKRLANMGALADQEAYLKSYSVTTKGYYLGAYNFGDVGLQEVYEDTVYPGLWSAIHDSLEKCSKDNLLSNVSDLSVATKNLDIVTKIIDASQESIFEPVLDYSSRLVVMNKNMKGEGRMLPLFYSFSPAGITFTSSDANN